MANLEKLGLLEKPHTSGGRVPTSQGYEVYVNKIKDSKTNVSKIKKQIKEIFKNRDNSIDEVLDQALDLINTSTKSVILSKKSLDSVTLQDIKAYRLDGGIAMIIAVFSNGTINNIETSMKGLKFEDVETAINIFSERLRGTKASELPEKALGLRDVIEDQIKDLEDNFQEFVRNMFKALLASSYEYSDTGALVTRQNIEHETLQKLMQSIKDESI
jgi:heat-inducible transcriptional repressor